MGVYWTMESVRLGSKPRPPLLPAEVSVALRTLHRGEAMGLLEASDPDLEAGLVRLMEALQRERIASNIVTKLDHGWLTGSSERDRVGNYLEAIFEALGENPVPRLEANALLKHFSDEQLAELLRISSSSVQRYARGERTVPEPVADRLHWLALVVGHLSGTYNSFGVRRWFERPRTALGGNSPKGTLLADPVWTSESVGAREVAELARALIGMPAT